MIAIALAANGCRPSGSLLMTATGVVIAAEGADATRVDTFTLRTDDGQTLDFTVGVLDVSNGGLPASHLREHMTSGEPITVTYGYDDGVTVAVRYEDAVK